MKFCPNCGMPIENKIKCQCGFDVILGEVDEEVFEKYKEKTNSLYESQKDVMNANNPLNNQKIFNKENDYIIDSSEILKNK
ncbi:MAG: hypothetical protein IKJ43_04875 [Bacilli bacterium]|nr:hypothetical protein [Bacilli bacterium]